MSYSEIKNKMVKVRRKQCCIWCAETIEKGNEAQYRVYKFHGNFNNDWMHPECYKSMNEYEYQGEGWEAGQFKRGTTVEN